LRFVGWGRKDRAQLAIEQEHESALNSVREGTRNRSMPIPFVVMTEKCHERISDNNSFCLIKSVHLLLSLQIFAWDRSAQKKILVITFKQ
jgi:hypothetical protein